MARALPGDDLSRIPTDQLLDELGRRDRRSPGPVVDLRLPEPLHPVREPVAP